MALMAAINIIVAEIAGLSLIASLFLILILPLTSAIVEFTCKDRYFPIYAIATFGLSLGLTFWNIETTIFYVFPSIVTGYIFGLLGKKKIPAIWAVFAASIAQFAITYAFIPLIDFIFQVDIIWTFKTALGLNSFEHIDEIVPLFIFFISFVQILLSYIIVSQELKKFGVDEIDEKISHLLSSIFGIAFALLIILFYFFSIKIAYLSLAFSIYFASYSLIKRIAYKNVFELISYVASLLLMVFLYALIQEKLKPATQLLLVGIFPLLVSVISLLFSFLKKKKEKIK